MKVNKTEHLVDVLPLKLTEYHYYESLGYRGYVEANTSFYFELSKEHFKRRVQDQFVDGRSKRMPAALLIQSSKDQEPTK
jgi:hypothetical protein